MGEKPILFSAPMVRALLDGRKTQTRRVVKPQPTAEGAAAWNRGFGAAPPFPCPYGKPGDSLWVRETCRAEELSRPPQTRPATRKERKTLGRTTVVELDELDGRDGVRYLADGAWVLIENAPEAGERWSDLYHYRGQGKNGIGNTVTSIHMPRWASRITLRITDVRVERLNDISEEDCAAEGVGEPYFGDGDPPFVEPGVMVSRRMQFRNLWNRINGPGSWDANPWCWAVSFERVPA